MRILLIILVFFLPVVASGQNKLSFYRMMSDSLIYMHMDTALFHNLTCTRFSVRQKDNRRWIGKNYESFKNEIIDPQLVTFNYTFFSATLKSEVNFDVSINKNMGILDSSLRLIPKCILQNTGCNFITKEDATRIALIEHILYPENLSTEFKAGSKNVYWVITGYPNSGTQNTNTRLIVEGQRKIINAITGEISPNIE